MQDFELKPFPGENVVSFDKRKAYYHRILLGRLVYGRDCLENKLKNSKLMLIVSGSSMSFIENEILGYKNPLYGRTTGIYKLEPLLYSEAVEFFPNYSSEDKVLKVVEDSATPISKIVVFRVLYALSKATIEKALAKLVSENRIQLIAKGRYAKYFRM